MEQMFSWFCDDQYGAIRNCLHTTSWTTIDVENNRLEDNHHAKIESKIG